VLEDALRFAERTPAGSIPEGLLAEGRALTEQIRDLIGGLDADQVERLDELRDGLDRAQAMSLVLTVVVVPFALFGTLIAVLLFTTGLVRGVKRIEANAVRMETGEPLLDPPHGTDELARLGQALLHTAARVAEQDAELRELALEDPLTGLRNRRAFLQIAEHELQVALRRTSVTALLFFDIDGLKAVNDNLGHAEGDRMLQGFAEVLRTELRASDLIARIGGDEFCVLLSRDTAMDGGQILERLERAVAKRNDEPGRRYRLAFSVGVAFFDPSDPVEVERLLEEADAAMYEQKRAKRAGHAVV
jgi:diguanylate cyclase (GGDEF)-like protein